jgi:hypothetical protein
MPSVHGPARRTGLDVAGGRGCTSPFDSRILQGRPSMCAAHRPPHGSVALVAGKCNDHLPEANLGACLSEFVEKLSRIGRATCVKSRFAADGRFGHSTQRNRPLLPGRWSSRFRSRSASETLEVRRRGWSLCGGCVATWCRRAHPLDLAGREVLSPATNLRRRRRRRTPRCG